jgi:hypothetical protein
LADRAERDKEAVVRQVLVLVVVGALSAVVVATSAARPVSVRETPPSAAAFTDPTGDSGTAVDVAGLTVSNDADGNYTFEVALATVPTTDQSVSVLLDTDLNHSTGLPGLGADYAVITGGSESVLFKGDANGLTLATATTLSESLVGTHVVIKINRSDLGGASSFNVWVLTLNGDGSDKQRDIAPDSLDGWQYQFKPLRLSLAAVHPGTAHAHGTWTYGIHVDRSDTGVAVGSEGTIRCAATGGGHPLAVAGHVFVTGGGGTATFADCTVRVPASLRGKLVHGTVTVSYHGLAVTHSFVVRAH